MAVQTPTTSVPATESKIWPFIALAVLGGSISLMFVNDNSFLLMPPVLVIVISALRVRSNRWYLLPLIPAGVFVIFMAVALISGWVSTAG